jgi:hypothetical protein
MPIDDPAGPSWIREAVRAKMAATSRARIPRLAALAKAARNGRVTGGPRPRPSRGRRR